MEIRYLSSSDDRLAVSKIYEESWKYAYRNIVPQDFLNSIPSGRWASNLERPDWYTMLCIENDIPVGTASFGKSRWEQFPNCGELISIYFLPKYMNKGFGRQLIQAVIVELGKLGFSEILLWVLEENANAQRFYEKCGFCRTDDFTETVIGGKTLREIRYTYRII